MSDNIILFCSDLYTLCFKRQRTLCMHLDECMCPPAPMHRSMQLGGNQGFHGNPMTSRNTLPSAGDGVGNISMIL